MKKVLSLLLAVTLVFAATVPSCAYFDSHTGGQTKTIGACGYIDEDGGLWLWGPNNWCQCGQEKCSWIDTPVKAMDHVVAFDRNEHCVIALKDDGSVWTLGLDYSAERQYIKGYQKSDGKAVYSYAATPDPVKRLDGCIAVAVGRLPEFAALKKDGSLYTWGDTTGGCLGFDTATGGPTDLSYFAQGKSGTKLGEIIKPYKIMSGVKAIAMGKYMGMAVKTDNSLWYWGSAGWFGSYSYSPDVDAPQKILDGVTQMCAGDLAGAVKTDGSAWIWGDGKNFTKRVKIADNVLKISSSAEGTQNPATDAYEYDTYVLKKDGTLWAKNGTVKLYDNVNDVHSDFGGFEFGTQTLVLLNDGRLIALKGSEAYAKGEKLEKDTVIAEHVALSGKPFSSIHTDDAATRVGGFVDVHENDWFAKSVAWAVDKGITSGTSKNTFSPSKTCSVAEILTFLWVSQGAPQPASLSHYTNVNGEWYTQSANWAYEQGLIESAVFPANDPCTRYMAVEYLWKLEGCPDVRKEGHYTYVIDVPYGEDDPVQWALREGITSGVAKSTDSFGGIYFAPERTCTRAQIVTFLYAAYEVRQ